MRSVPSTHSKNEKIQLLRAAAIICVVMIHTTPAGRDQLLSRPFTNICVAVFFFLSGWLTPLDIPHPASFCRKRILRVLVPYLVWVTLCTIQLGEPDRLWYYLLTAKAGPQFYYVHNYIQLVLITPLLKRFICSKYRFLGWLVTPLCMIGYKYIPLLTGHSLSPMQLIIFQDFFLRWFTYYFFGILLGNGLLNVKAGLKPLSLLYLVSLPVQAYEALLWLRLGEKNCGTQMKLSVFVTSMLFLCIVSHFLRSERPLRQTVPVKVMLLIGDCSFGIYLSHVFFLRLLRGHVPLFKSLPFCLNSIALVLLCLAVVLLGQKLFGRRLGAYLGFY